MAVMLCTLVLLLGGCTLPAEERAFAVAFGVGESQGVWEVYARIPNYQQGGGYLTISAKGASMEEAVALLNACAPMEMHLGQLRLMIITQGLAESGRLPAMAAQLCRSMEVRVQCGVCVTSDALGDVMDALTPLTGSRLSKSLDTWMESLQKMGIVPAVTLGELSRMGERQQCVLMYLGLENTAGNAMPGMDGAAGELAMMGGGKVQLAGSCMMSADGQMKGRLTAMEQQVLSLMTGQMKRGVLTLPETVVTLNDADCRVTLQEDTVSIRVALSCKTASRTMQGVEEALHQEIDRLMTTLTRAGCDALGLGRQEMRRCLTVEAWHNMHWQEKYPAVKWVIHVEAEGAA